MKLPPGEEGVLVTAVLKSAVVVGHIFLISRTIGFAMAGPIVKVIELEATL